MFFHLSAPLSLSFVSISLDDKEAARLVAASHIISLSRSRVHFARVFSFFFFFRDTDSNDRSVCAHYLPVTLSVDGCAPSVRLFGIAAKLFFRTKLLPAGSGRLVDICAGNIVPAVTPREFCSPRFSSL